MSEGTLESLRGRVLAELDSWAQDFAGPLATRFGNPAEKEIATKARQGVEALLPLMADPGWRAPMMRAFSISGLVYVAMYLALAERGCDPAGAWEICEAATRAHFARLPRLAETMASAGMFSWPARAMARSVAERSRQAPVGGWTLEFVDGQPGGFDYGVDYTRCAIRELAVSAGAAAFAPYICLADIAGSEAFGWGLVRSETLAQGGTRCDFRFRRGHPTQVKVLLPVIR